MRLLENLLDNNVRWAESIKKQDPEFFTKLAKQQSPEYLWIGCSDSRVPANELLGLLPGDVFVHRNVANVVIHTDLNCLSVLQYAIDVLHVKHVIVTGHYGCGGVRAAMENKELGLIDNWLRNIKDTYHHHHRKLDLLSSNQAKLDALCELNVRAQVANVCHTTVVQNAWRRGQELSVHGWIYSIADGILHDLEVTVTGLEQVPEIYHIEPNSK